MDYDFIFTCPTCNKETLRASANATECKRCISNRRVREWKRANLDRARQLNKESASRNKESIRAKNAAYQKANPEKVLARVKAYQARHRDRYLAQQAKYRDENRDALRVKWGVRRHRKRLHWGAEDVAVFYQSAQRVTQCLGISHEVDHIIPLNGKRVSGLHVPENLQVLPWRINRSKQNKVAA